MEHETIIVTSEIAELESKMEQLKISEHLDEIKTLLLFFFGVLDADYYFSEPLKEHITAHTQKLCTFYIDVCIDEIDELYYELSAEQFIVRISEINEKIKIAINFSVRMKDILLEYFEDEIYKTTNINDLINSKQDFSRLIIKNVLSIDHKILIDHIQVRFNTLIDIDRTKHIKTNKQKIIDIATVETEQSLTFKGLFISPYSENIAVLIEQLQNVGLIDANNNWRPWEKGRVNKNEASKFYYYLDQNNVLNDNDKTPALICFNDKFGIEGYKDAEEPKTERCVCVRELTRSEKTATKLKLLNKFEIVFQRWNDEIRLK